MSRIRVAKFKLRASFAALVEFETALLHIAHCASALAELNAKSIAAANHPQRAIFSLWRLLLMWTFDDGLALIPVTQSG